MEKTPKILIPDEESGFDKNMIEEAQNILKEQGAGAVPIEIFVKDSFDSIDYIVFLAKENNIRIPDEDILEFEKLKTLEDVDAFVEKKKMSVEDILKKQN